MNPEFEEKSFESAFNSELERRNKRRIFSPGQMAENTVGVDVLSYVGKRHPFWRAVGSRFGRGGSLAYSSSSGKKLVPNEVFNVFLQYKRTEIMVGAKARHYRYFGGEYMRFKVDSPIGQKETMLILERAVGQAGHVSYVAPAFTTLDMLREAQRRKRVMVQSVAVKPSEFEPDHTSYNFTQAAALFNSEPTPTHTRDGAHVLSFDGGEEVRGFGTFLRSARTKILSEDGGPAIEGAIREVERAKISLQDLDLDATKDREAADFLLLAAVAASADVDWICVNDAG